MCQFLSIFLFDQNVTYSQIVFYFYLFVIRPFLTSYHSSEPTYLSHLLGSHLGYVR